MYHVLEVVGSHELFLNYGRMDYGVLCLVHAIFEVEILYVYAHVLGYYVGYEDIDM